MCQVGVFNEGRTSSRTIRLSNKCKRVFNKACTMPWSQTVVHFEVKMSDLQACFRTVVVTVEAHLQSRTSFFHGDFECVTQE